MINGRLKRKKIAKKREIDNKIRFTETLN